MKSSLTQLSVIAFALATGRSVQAGPIAMGLCYSACNAGYVACCAGAGATAGTFTLGLGAPAALMACSVVQGTCMAACTPFLAAPSP
ncbi:hypothetical protein FS749_012700 [Ceratobasidium sp. UAMH 11750]|nr:hypothetical protein FS749_012700 [Ceratobasidium sp. UAMH 11750]